MDLRRAINEAAERARRDCANDKPLHCDRCQTQVAGWAFLIPRAEPEMDPWGLIVEHLCLPCCKAHTEARDRRHQETKILRLCYCIFAHRMLYSD